MSKQAAAPLRLVRAARHQKELTLSEQQKAAIAHRGSPLIISGATGTGKTATLIHAAVARINSGQDPNSLLILTYGRERAGELRDSIVVAARETVHEPLARTFHSLAYSILKMRSASENFKLVLLSGAEQESYIAQLLQGDIEDGYRQWPAELRATSGSMGEPLATQGFVRELRDLMMRASERSLGPEQLAERGHQLREKYWPAAAAFWQRYLGAMAIQADSAGDSKVRIDPSEIIVETIKFLQENPPLLAELRNRFTTIMIDEFQESDPAQRTLLQLLAPSDLVIVADPASAVGRFRGADPEGVPHALDYYRALGAHEITLTDNFRGVPRIATALSSSASEEAHHIAHQFKRAHLIEGAPYSEMAVIVRSQGSTVAAIRRAFAQVGIPTAVDVEILAHNPAIAPFLLLARVATGAQPLNVDTAEKLLLSEFGGATSVSLRRTRAALLAARDEVTDKRSGTQLILDAITTGDVTIEDSAELLRVHHLLSAAKKSLRKKSATIHDLLWAIWDNAESGDGIKLADAWKSAALRGGSRGAAADRDLDAMIQLFDSAARHLERFPGAAPDIFLHEISQETIATDIITARGIRADVVEILTVHSAKGRQWRYVAVAGVQEGIWPNLKQRSSLLGAERLVERVRHGDEIAEQTLNVIAAQSLAEDEARLFHVATTRAQEFLLVTAISREEDMPSPYFDNMAELHPQDAITELPRPLTTPALVATLRREVALHSDTTAAGLLKTLSQEGILIAHPKTWMGAQPLSTEEPVIAEGAQIPISPSSAENFTECGLKWFLEKSGGTNGDTTAQLLGSVIHEFARMRVEEPEISDIDLQNKLIEAWPLIDDSQGWVSAASLSRAKRMLEKFAQYHRETKRTVVGVEMGFEITLGRVTVKGNVDRIEVDSDGKYYIIDFKTGKSPISQSDADENLQLACYQLGLILDGFTDRLPGNQVSGSELVYLATDAQKASTRTRAPIDPLLIQETITTIARDMSRSTFMARKNDMCARCKVKPVCPLHLEGKAVHE
jgi:superfamily I DNA/RNA helicase/RecB family exonuclease